MENSLQISNEENYFIQKRNEIDVVLKSNNKVFLQESYNFNKLHQIKTDANFVFLVGGWVTQTSMLMQIKNPVDGFIKQDIVNMLTTVFSNLSIEELIKAFELERFSVYKEKTEHFQ